MGKRVTVFDEKRNAHQKAQLGMDQLPCQCMFLARARDARGDHPPHILPLADLPRSPRL